MLGTIPLPTTVVTSARNLNGLTSLVEAELFESPGNRLFGSFADALAGCDWKYVAVCAR